MQDRVFVGEGINSDCQNYVLYHQVSRNRKRFRYTGNRNIFKTTTKMYEFPVMFFFEKRYADPVFTGFVVTPIFVNFLHAGCRLLMDSSIHQYGSR